MSKQRALFSIVQAAVCGLVLGLTVVICDRCWQRSVVKATGFQVVDAGGHVRATLGPLADGAVALRMTDAAGVTRSGLAVQTDGTPALEMYDAAGKARVQLSAIHYGNGVLYLWNHSGIDCTAISAGNGKADISLLDQWQHTRAGLQLLYVGPEPITTPTNEEISDAGGQQLFMVNKWATPVWGAPKSIIEYKRTHGIK